MLSDEKWETEEITLTHSSYSYSNTRILCFLVYDAFHFFFLTLSLTVVQPTSFFLIWINSTDVTSYLIHTKVDNILDYAYVAEGDQYHLQCKQSRLTVQIHLCDVKCAVQCGKNIKKVLLHILSTHYRCSNYLCVFAVTCYLKCLENLLFSFFCTSEDRDHSD